MASPLQLKHANLKVQRDDHGKLRLFEIDNTSQSTTVNSFDKLPTIVDSSITTLAVSATKSEVTTSTPAIVLREAILRPGRSLKDIDKPNNQRILKVQQEGTIVDPPCSSCSNRKHPGGPWILCVIQEGKFKGSCVNCHIIKDSTKCLCQSYTLCL